LNTNVNMPKKISGSKKVVLAVRVSPHIKNTVVKLASTEDMDVSEWIRNLIRKELDRRGLLHKRLTLPYLEDIGGESATHD